RPPDQVSGHGIDSVQGHGGAPGVFLRQLTVYVQTVCCQLVAISLRRNPPTGSAEAGGSPGPAARQHAAHAQPPPPGSARAPPPRWASDAGHANAGPSATAHV